jgi:transposase
MAKPYSQDLRKRMIREVETGDSRQEVARTFSVSPSCVVKLLQQWEATGDCRPRDFGGHKPYALAAYEAEVRALVAAQPDLTVTELWHEIKARGIKAGRSAVGRFLQHLGLTYKKNTVRRRATTAGRSGRPRRLAGDAKKP